MKILPFKTQWETKPFIFLLVSFLFVFEIKAQTPDIVQVSYQELTTTIRSQTVDENGNTFYAGVFKGALVVNGDTLAFGRGGDDYFLLKKSNFGVIEWVIPFGSEKSDDNIIRVLYHAGYVYITFATPYVTEIADITIPLLQPTGLTNCMVQLDTEGNIQWYKRSNYAFQQIWSIGKNIMARCIVGSTSPPLLFETQSIFNSNGFINQVFIQINDQGNVVGNFSIYNEFNANSNLNVLVKKHPNLNQIYFWVLRSNQGIQNGSNTINFKGKLLSLTSNLSRHLMVKTDTLFDVLASSTLDPSGGFILSGTFTESRFIINEEGTEMNLYLNSGIYEKDGFNDNIGNKNAIVVLDTNLVTKEIRTINPNNQIDGERRVQLNYFQQTINNYFFLGHITGKNQSPAINQIPKDERQIQLLKGYTISFNLNGPSRSFLIKTNKNLDFEEFTWVTDQSFLEIMDVGFEEFLVTPNRIQFINSMDNVWNPWEFNKNLQIVNGGNKHSADQTDYIERVRYFPNKTKALFGLANGLTAFDKSDANVVKAGNRRDFFYAFIDSNNQLIKYNRLFSSFGTHLIRGVQSFNDSIFVLIRFTSPRNQAGFNYVKMGEYVELIASSNHTVMFAFDTLGNFSIRDLQNTQIGAIGSFDIFPNGDFGYLSGNTSISLNLDGNIFPFRNGFYIVRSPKNGIITQAMKIFPNSGLTPIGANEIIIEKSTEDIVVNMLGDIGANGPDFDIITARNGNIQTVLKIANPSPGATARKYYNIIFKTSFSQDRFAGALGPFSSVLGGSALITTLNENTYVGFRSGNSNEKILYQDKLLLPEGSNFQSGFFLINHEGKFKAKINFNKISNFQSPSLLPFRIRSLDNHLLIIGSNAQSLKFGALEIPYMGERDGIILKMDSSFNLVQFYSVASIYSDICSDIDTYTDSSFVIAYQSQGSPTQAIGLNQISFFNASSTVSPSDFDASGFISQINGAIVPPDFIFTTKHGEWHDPTIWNTGKIPMANDRIFIRHKVQVLQPAICFQLFADPTADLKLFEGVFLEITGRAIE